MCHAATRLQAQETAGLLARRSMPGTRGALSRVLHPGALSHPRDGHAASGTRQRRVSRAPKRWSLPVAAWMANAA
jgi:hypothetical protein